MASNLAWSMASLDAVVNNGLEIDIWIVFLQGVCLYLSMTVLLEHSFMFCLDRDIHFIFAKLKAVRDIFERGKQDTAQGGVAGRTCFHGETQFAVMKY